jgi:hypothetical protein
MLIVFYITVYSLGRCVTVSASFSFKKKYTKLNPFKVSVSRDFRPRFPSNCMQWEWEGKWGVYMTKNQWSKIS